MRPFSVLALFTGLAFLVAEHSIEASLVVAGSSATPPPAFQNGPHFQVTPVIDRAHPFTIDANGPYRVDQLQIAAYRFASRDPVIAKFAIHADTGGVPGPSLTTFNLNEIPLDMPSILTSKPNSALVLVPNANYWLVGSSMQGQMNWSLAQGFPTVNVSGTYAYQLRNDPWVVVPNAQLAAFAILGTPVPEPASLAILVAGSVIVGCFMLTRSKHCSSTSA